MSVPYQHSTISLFRQIILSILASLLLNSAALAEKRVALVVGNASYKNVPSLDNPANDARLMAGTLRTLGFTIVGSGAQIDLDKSSFDSAIRSFGRQLQGADVGLFYYAGHGLQVRGANYLVPINANPTREADLDFELEDVGLVLRQMEASGTRLNIVFLDACRNNPFGGRGLRAVETGLAQMRAPEGTLISFATQPGSVAQDGTDGHSPFTDALARTIRKAGLGIFDTLNEVGLAVKSATGGSQQPWFSTSPINGTFYFAPVIGALPANPPPASTPAVVTAPPAKPQATPASKVTTPAAPKVAPAPSAPPPLAWVISPAGQKLAVEQDNLMRFQGKNVYIVVGKMVRGDIPYDQKAVDGALSELEASVPTIPKVFQTNPKEDVVNATYGSSPKIWQNKADFDSRVPPVQKVISDLKGKIKDLDDLKVAFNSLNDACNGCHQTYRLKLK
jgi:cytochrome c556